MRIGLTAKTTISDATAASHRMVRLLNALSLPLPVA